MKKLMIVSFASLLLFSCGDSTEESKDENGVSKKGAWSKEEKGKFQSKCNEELGKIMGENTDKFCGCVGEKVEKVFDNFDSADKAMNGAEGSKIAEECATQVMKDAMKDMNLPETPAAAEESPADEM
jgi:SPX domain protein involved in polyphosphate accumulation